MNCNERVEAILSSFFTHYSSLITYYSTLPRKAIDADHRPLVRTVTDLGPVLVKRLHRKEQATSLDLSLSVTLARTF